MKKTTLRQQAEETLSKRKKSPATKTDTTRLLHELEVHQIELEMQNAELAQSHAETEAALRQYTDLYDFAPVGYFTLARDGAIHQVNMAGANLLGVDAKRGKLLKRRFGIFVSDQSRTTFSAFLNQVFISGKNEVCEIELLNNNSAALWVHLEAVADGAERETCRAVAVDISARKQAEDQLRETQSFLATLLEVAPISIYTLTLDNRFGLVNRQWAQDTQVDRKKAIGRSLENIFPAELARKYAADNQQVLQSHSTLTFEEWAETPDGMRCYHTLKFPLHNARGVIENIGGVSIDITERKQAENKLRESEARLLVAQSVTKVGSWETDLSTLEVIWSAQTYEIFDLDRNTFHATHPAFLGFVHPDDRAKVDEAFVNSFNSNVYNTIEHRVVTNKGVTKYVEERWRILRNDQEQPTRAVGTCQDITERKQADEKLRESEARLQFVMLATQDAVYDWDLLSGHVFRNAAYQKLFSPDEPVGTDQTWWEKQLFPDDRERIMASIGSLFGEKQQFWSGEYRFRRHDGNYAYVIDRGYIMYDGTGKAIRMIGAMTDFSERKEAEEKLHASEQRLKLAVRAGHIGVWDWDVVNDRTVWADNMYDMYGIHKEDFDGAYDAWAETLHPDDREAIDAEIEAALNGEREYAPEFRIISGDGSIKFIQAASKTIFDANGNATRMIGINMDITERKVAEINLKMNADMWNNIINTANDGIISLNEKQEIILINQAAETIFGYAEGSLLGKNLNLIIPEKSRKAHPQHIAKYGESGTSHRAMFSFGGVSGLRSNGEEFSIEASISQAQSAKGKIYSVIVRDITERQLAEEALRQAQEERKILLDTIDGIVWDADANTFIFSYVSQWAERLLGYPVTRWTSEPTFWKDHIHPDDQIWAVEYCVAQTLAQTAHEFEYRMIAEDGHIVWLRDIVTVISENDQPIKLHGIMVDITERKLAEAQLSQIKERLFNIVHSAMDAIITVGADQRITLFNAAAEKIFKHSADEAIGKPLEIFIPQQHRAGHQSHIEGFGKTGVTSRAMNALRPLTALRSDGQEFPIEASISQVIVDGQQMFTVILRDITERILAEEITKTSLQEKETLLKEIHHRVKNNLQVISSLLYLQSRKSRDENVQTMFLESQNRIASMALIHEKLYQSTDLAHLSFADYARDMTDTLFHAYGVGHAQVTLSVEDNGLALDINNAVPCGLIINEIVSNSLKYAFPDHRLGNILITLSLLSADRFNLTISDDGAGLPADFEQRSAASLGSKLIERLVEQINGTLERFSSDQGTRYVISFPREV